VLDAAHIANIEQPRVYADTVLKFLLNLESEIVVVTSAR
jgi:hypothetical protein